MSANRITGATILAEVADFHGVTIKELKSRCTIRSASHARIHAYHALREYGLSTTQIGKMLNRDHSTVSVLSKRWPEIFAGVAA